MIKTIEELKCVHRHSISEHPSCFMRGLLSRESIKFLKSNDIVWYNVPGMKIGYIDIETTTLNANFGSLLSWAIKEKDGEVAWDVVSSKEAVKFEGEKRILKSLLREMRKYTILVGYYSGNYHFDMPFIRTKAIHYGYDFPGYGEQYHFDLYTTVKSKMKLTNNKLATVCEYFGIVGKTPLNFNTWRMATYGDKKALAEVVEHNIGDVEITNVLHDKLEPFARWNRTSI